ncbi:hypothetical protein QE377_003277 [Microbacterium sp. SORGH_AS 862]|nr:hypothetical protein [Microbacterium sp. SORGH_AS_0862]
MNSTGRTTPVLQRATVAVRVVGPRDAVALGVGVIFDERDGGGIGAEGRAGQQEPTGRATVRLAQRIAPAERVAAVVHLVEDDETALLDGQVLVDGRLDRHLRVRHRDPVVLPSRNGVAVAEMGVEADAHPRRRIRPLGLEVLRRCDHDDAVDDATTQQLAREAQREGRLSGAGGGRGQEVARTLADAVGTVRREVMVEGLRLPGAQPLCGSPRRSLRIRRREVLGGETADVFGSVLIDPVGVDGRLPLVVHRTSVLERENPR